MNQGFVRIQRQSKIPLMPFRTGDFPKPVVPIYLVGASSSGPQDSDSSDLQRHQFPPHEGDFAVISGTALALAIGSS